MSETHGAREHYSDEFNEAVAPLSIEVFNRMPPADRDSAWERYLATVKSDDIADRIMARCTGPSRICWKHECRDPAEAGEWYCKDHSAPNEPLEAVCIAANMYTSDDDYGKEMPTWLFVLCGLAIVFGLLILWGVVHGLGLPPILGGPGNP